MTARRSIRERGSRFEVPGSEQMTRNAEPRTRFAVHCCQCSQQTQTRKAGRTMQLTYLGHSGFMLQAGGKTVLIDPWVTGNPLATTEAENLTAETILLSHAHNDHGAGDALSISKRTGATIISTFELGVWLGAQGANAN